MSYDYLPYLGTFGIVKKKREKKRKAIEKERRGKEGERKGEGDEEVGNLG